MSTANRPGTAAARVGRPRTISPPLLHRTSRRGSAITVCVVLLALAGLAIWAGLAKLITGAGPSWETATRDWLLARTWSEPVVWVIAAAVVLLGVILVLLAIIPGPRNGSRLTVADPEHFGHDRSYLAPVLAEDFMLGRRALARLVAARVDLLDGISSVAVSTGNGVIGVRVNTPTRQTEVVRSAVLDLVNAVVQEVGLDPRPKVSASVTTREGR